MGGVLSLFRRTRKILILGPSHSGKTAIFEQIAYMNKAKPKINAHRHFNFVKIKNYNVWDLAGANDALRSWTYYYDNAACVVFVYDAENSEESEKVLKDLCYTKELRNAALLIVINKFTKDAGEQQCISKIVKRRLYYTTVITRDQKPKDIKQGFDWILKNV